MAARKLQAEMDRTYKRIVEGVENFQDIETKMNAASSAAQKEKYEADLKTQIKRLQRLRDQLKTWQAGSEVKDKGPLLEHRKLIEVQMERFKVIEKEMKTKAYSKEGLISSNRIDAKEQQRLDLLQWISEKVDELQRQVEAAEAEIESTQAGAKKKGKAGEAGQARIDGLELLNDRRQWHISQLEIILRLLENSSLKAEEVETVKEDVDFFVQMNAEEDFDYDEGVYADLNLENYVEAEVDGDSAIGSDDDTEGMFLNHPKLISVEPTIPADLPPRTPMKKSATRVEDDTPKEDASNSKRLVPARPRARSIAKPQEAPKAALPTANFAAQSMATALKAGVPPVPAVPPRPQQLPLRYAAAAALATQSPLPASTSSGSNTTTAAPTSAILPSTAAPPQQQPTPTTNYSATTPASDMITPLSPSIHESSFVESPVTSSAPGRGPTAERRSSVAPSAPSGVSMSLASPVVSIVDGIATSPQVCRPPVQSTYFPDPLQRGPTANLVSSQIQQAPIGPPPGLSFTATSSQPTVARDDSVPAHIPETSTGHGVIGSGAVPAINGHNGRDLDSAVVGGQQQPQSAANQAPQLPQQKTIGTLSDLVSTFQNVQRKAYQRMGETDQIQGMLDAMSPTMPQPRDADRPRYHAPKHPIQTPSYYPQAVPALLSTPEFYERLDLETLFWVFYYMPGTYQQWLASQELKRQSWRFHVKFLTWFQRHAKPEEVTEDWEQGQYLYFDWEGSWCVRKKSGFRFEYRCLSEE